MGLINPFPDYPPLEPDTWKRPPWPMYEDVREISALISKQPPPGVEVPPTSPPASQETSGLNPTRCRRSAAGRTRRTR